MNPRLLHPASFPRRLLAPLLLATLLLAGQPAARAAQPAPVPLDEARPGEADITFAMLGAPELLLTSPGGESTLLFAVPERWQVNAEDSALQLHYDVLIPNTSGAPAVLESATADVFVNGAPVGELPLAAGAGRTARLDLPAEAVDEATNEIVVQFVFATPQERPIARLRLRGDSFVHLVYEIRPPTLDLGDFPRPLISDSPAPDTILLIGPDDPTDDELSLLAAVAATIGRAGQGRVRVEWLAAREATPARLAGHAAIVVGRSRRNAFLADLYAADRLPITLAEGEERLVGRDGSPIDDAHGVLQLTLSDDGRHAYLVVTGVRNDAVEQAARALGLLAGGGLRFAVQGDLAVVADVAAATADDATDVITFAEMGFGGTTFRGGGAHQHDIDFFVPANWYLDDDPFVRFGLLTSPLVRGSQFQFDVLLNGRLVGTVRHDARDVALRLPAREILVGGRNRLSLRISLGETPAPGEAVDTRLWARISDEGQLEIPYTASTMANPAATINDPLAPLLSPPDLSRLVIILPSEPTPSERQGAILAAWRLGVLSNSHVFAPVVTRDDGVIEQDLSGRHALAIGRPTQNAVIAASSSVLPQPFAPRSDALAGQREALAAQLPGETGAGLIQSVPAPWDARMTLTVFTGTDDAAVGRALATLADADAIAQFDGNLIFVGEAKLAAVRVPVDNMSISGEEGVAFAGGPAATAEAGTALVDVPLRSGNEARYAPQDASRPLAVTLAIIALTSLGVLIGAAGLYHFWQGQQESGS